jgi:hypothetical protein
MREERVGLGDYPDHASLDRYALLLQQHLPFVRLLQTC